MQMTRFLKIDVYLNLSTSTCFKIKKVLIIFILITFYLNKIFQYLNC